MNAPSLATLKAVVFGDRFIDPAFLAAVNSALVNCALKIETTPACKNLTFVFDNFPSSFPVLRLLVDLAYTF